MTDLTFLSAAYWLQPPRTVEPTRKTLARSAPGQTPPGRKRRMSRMRMWVWTMPFVLAALIASQAVAQGVDPKSEKELRELGQKIDKNSSSADSGRVTSKIVDQWKGTQFQFAAGGNPRQLTGDDVQKLRQRRLGNGEISILLALAAKQT